MLITLRIRRLRGKRYEKKAKFRRRPCKRKTTVETTEWSRGVAEETGDGGEMDVVELDNGAEWVAEDDTNAASAAVVGMSCC